MGIVYKTRDLELGVDVALKVLRPDLGTSPEWLERFRRELVLAREVTHPNVVRIHDIGESEGLRFLTMRYVEGRSLRDVLTKEGPLPPERAARIVRQLAAALEQAHGAGVVHRDLKPANVLVEADDTAYITDFGVARTVGGEALTRTGAVVGTLDYLSPEQVAGAPVDGRSDLFALGILFFEMLSGELPFRGDTQAERVAGRLTGRAHGLRRTGRPVPRHVEAVIRRCLECNPARRYQTARELIADLDREHAPARWKPVLPVALPLALLAAVGAWGLLRPRSGLPLPPFANPGKAAVPQEARPALAVLPLADETADASLAWSGAGIAEMLAARLAESPELRVVEPTRVRRTLKDLQITAGGYDDQVLRRLSELLGASTLVSGSVRRAGPAVRVDLRTVSVRAAGVETTRTLGRQSPTAASLVSHVSGLAERLRQELGARTAAPPEPAGAGTASLGAAENYSTGRGHVAVGDYVAAATAFERAVAADPAFAAALEGLSDAYQHLGYGDKALAAAEQAERLAGDAPSRLGYRVRARLALLRGRPAEAEEIYAELSRHYPGDTAALMDLADAQAAQGHIAASTETLKRVVSLDPSDPRAWFLLGKNAILTGDSGRAVSDYLLRCLVLQTRLRNEQGQGDALNAIGAAHHQLGDYAQAAEKYSASAGIRRRLGDERGTAMTFKNRARTYLALSRHAEAEADLRSAQQIYRRIGDQNGLADVLNDFGALQEVRGSYAEALRSYQDALRVRRDLGDKRQLAQSYDNVGYIFYLQGEYDHALVYWKEALELHRDAGEELGLILSTQNMGFLQLAQGRWDEAVRSFATALEKSREIDHKESMATSFGNMGVLHHYEGRYGPALASFAQALSVLGELGDKRGLTEYTLKEAAASLEVGRFDEAQAKLRAALGWLQETGNIEQTADHAMLLGQWQTAQGRKEEARRAFARALEKARQSKGRIAILRARITEGGGLAALGDAAAAVDRLTPAAREADAIGDALLQIQAAVALARAELGRRQVDAAEVWARKALRLAERCGWHAGLYRIHALLGRILAARGDEAGAGRAWADSAREVARLRQGLDPALRRSFDSLPAVREVDAVAARNVPGSGA